MPNMAGQQVTSFDFWHRYEFHGLESSQPVFHALYIKLVTPWRRVLENLIFNKLTKKWNPELMTVFTESHRWSHPEPYECSPHPHCIF
jgi:hypothetical protein